MKIKIIIITFLSCCLVASSSPITERFTEDYDLRPYIKWIANNTRFVDAENIKNTDLPLFFLLSTREYKRIIPFPSLAAYVFDRNSIYVDQERVQGQPDIILHELIHFYQFRENSDMSIEQKEKEAYQIQHKFKSQQ